VTDRIAITGREVVRDGTAQVITARFRQAGADTTPTNVHWRLDSPDSGEVVADWQSETPGATVSIATTADHNTVRSCEPQERRILTVAADYGLAGQYVEAFEYSISNLMGIRRS